MALHFEPIHLKQQGAYATYLHECPQKTSDYSFINLWGWAEEYGLSWAWRDGLVWIKQTIPETVYWAPIGRWDKALWEPWLHDYVKQPTVFTRIPEALLQHWQKALGDRITIEEDRNHWDYIYLVDDLIALRGNRFHKKKNLLNQFLKKYRFEYTPFDTQTISKAMAMQEDWCTWRDCESSESLAAENRAITRILSNWEALPTVLGAAIMVDHEIAAYTIAEGLSDETLVIHFEKGDPNYKGVYQAINQIFLKHSGPRYKFVNREQDLGDDGLRKAKLSYHPIDFTKKYRIVLQ